MPRKPSSIYLIVEHPSSTVSPTPTMPATALQAWRLPLEDGEEPEDAAKRGYEQHPIGSTVVWVEDTKVEAKRVGLTLEDIDDIRLDQDEES